MTARLERMLLSLLAVLAAVYCFYVRSPTELAALLLPIMIHELSHAAALLLLGFRLRGLRLEPQGLCIRYEGSRSDLAHAAASLAGPAGGLLYTALLRSSYIPWLALSADVSLLFSLFNLLPLMPLDGGRAFLILCRAALGAAGEDLFQTVCRVFLALLLLFGVYAAVTNRGSAPLLAALWLLHGQKEQLPLVNQRDLL
ncbi:MAG: M50 family metallopeptidase [Eubacteriales bacterium]|nr:M50 family metallopeptidase [Eubacteriales bacterium]